MARPTVIRLSPVEFAMTCVLVRYAPPMLDALRSVLVDGSTVADASHRNGLNPNSVQSAKNRFWSHFVKLSRSYQAVYGALQDDSMLYRFILNSISLAPYRSADKVRGYGVDAARNELSPMAYEQIAAFSLVRSESALKAVKSVLCDGLSLDAAGKANSLTRQAVSQSCRAFQGDAWMLDEVDNVIYPFFAEAKIGVIMLSNERFLDFLPNLSRAKK